jgi:hypothetical protein
LTIPDAVAAQYLLMQKLQTTAVLAGRRAWAGIDPNNLSASWSQGVSVISGIVAGQQERAAVAGASYVSDALAENDDYSMPDAFVDPRGFAGFAADGRPLGSLLYSPITTTKRLIGEGASVQQALASGRSALDLILHTTISDAGRAASSVNIAARPRTGYVRMLSSGACSRCAVLAGRYYRWNAGFARHPQCACIHIPASENVAGSMKTDPYAYFKSLSAAEQDKRFGVAEAKAIRDGADMFQVVNAKRGVSYGGISKDGTHRGQKAGSFTTEGTSRRGNFGNTNGPRLTPEAIYSKGLPRDQTLKLLEQHGYILPGGQNPTGSIRGEVQGFGQLGRGGTRVGAREAVLNARGTGVRDPRVRATMTAAELRAFDAKSRWADVRNGVNPFNPKRPLTPEIAARVEKDFRRNVLGY